MAAGAVQGMGPGRAHRNASTCCSPRPRSACSRWWRRRISPRSCRSRRSPEDPTSAQHDEQLPTYNAYSIDGDVTAPLVYVNYGVPEDYEELDRLGISVKGAIVIARYGGSWRGIKPKVAAEHGAVGCLIYSDPRDDGYTRGEVFPKGPYRPKDGVQRGSVMDMPVYPGDPLTPGVGATKDAKRLPHRAGDDPHQDSGDADFLRRRRAAAGRARRPRRCRRPGAAALPLTYRVGPGPAKVAPQAGIQLGSSSRSTT